MNIKPELICHLDEHIVFFYASLIRIKSIFMFDREKYDAG